MVEYVLKHSYARWLGGYCRVVCRCQCEEGRALAVPLVCDLRARKVGSTIFPKAIWFQDSNFYIALDIGDV